MLTNVMLGLIAVWFVVAAWWYLRLVRMERRNQPPAADTAERLQRLESDVAALRADLDALAATVQTVYRAQWHAERSDRGIGKHAADPAAGRRE